MTTSDITAVAKTAFPKTIPRNNLAFPGWTIMLALLLGLPGPTLVFSDDKDESEASRTEEEDAEKTEEATQDDAASFLGERDVFENEKVDVFTDHHPTYGSQTSFLEWHGYLAMEFDSKQGTHSNFDNHEFYLSTSATVSEKLSFLAEMEFEHTPEKLILPIQAFGRYKFAENHVFRAGLFFVPIQMPRNYTLRGNTNRLIRQVALTHDLMFENWSVVGLGLYGNLFKFNEDTQITYDLAVSNGLRGMATGDSWFDAAAGLQDHSEDNNDNKAVHGRFAVVSQDVLGGKLSLGGSFSRQNYAPASEPSRELNFVGMDLRYMWPSGWRIQAEWLDRSGDDNPADLEANGIGADADGYYFQLSKRFRPASGNFNYFELVGQVDEIDWNKDLQASTDRRTVAIGFNISPEPYLIFKTEYDFVKQIYGEDLDDNIFWFSVVFEF